MSTEQIYSLDDIRDRLESGKFPFSGMTPLGSAYFEFHKPCFYAGTAIHAGSMVRDEILEAMAVSKTDRYREEDPYTDRFIRDFPIQIIARYSRFEYDINRDKETTVYQTPEMAWGLEVLKRPLTDKEMRDSLEKYDEFHSLMDIVAQYLIGRGEYGVIFDCHSYNYQREEKLAWYEDKKPVINVGTGPVNRERFGPVIADLMNRLSKISVQDRPIYVGENVVFKGGHLSRRLSRAHYDNLLVFAIEFKKIFMDEWSGQVYEDILEDLVRQFRYQATESMKEPGNRSL